MEVKNLYAITVGKKVYKVVGSSIPNALDNLSWSARPDEETYDSEENEKFRKDVRENTTEIKIVEKDIIA